MAARLQWFYQFSWLLFIDGSLPIPGCSKDVVQSGSRAAPCLCFLPNCWLLRGSGSIRICGCSCRVVQSISLATQLSCFCLWLWLLCASVSNLKLWLLQPDGSLSSPECYWTMVRSSYLAAYIKCFYPREWLLFPFGSVAGYGYSMIVVLSVRVVALQIWFSDVEGLLILDGSLVNLGSGTRTRFQVWPDGLFWRPSAG
jgi:hypothetical protein